MIWIILDLIVVDLVDDRRRLFVFFLDNFFPTGRWRASYRRLTELTRTGTTFSNPGRGGGHRDYHIVAFGINFALKILKFEI